MDIIEAIKTRRSIRRFTGVPIGDDQLEIILKAGFQAPSAHNKQPWHFVVVRNPEALQKIADNHPYAKMLPQAGCGIVVCGDKNIEGMTGFLIENCSAAIENMLLAANGIGLGAVWCGVYPVTELTSLFTKVLELPANITPVGLVVIGNRSETRPAEDRFDKSKVHHDKF